jgi:hypothetical protein
MDLDIYDAIAAFARCQSFPSSTSTQVLFGVGHASNEPRRFMSC